MSDTLDTMVCQKTSKGANKLVPCSLLWHSLVHHSICPRASDIVPQQCQNELDNVMIESVSTASPLSSFLGKDDLTNRHLLLHLASPRLQQKSKSLV